MGGERRPGLFRECCITSNVREGEGEEKLGVMVETLEWGPRSSVKGARFPSVGSSGGG